MNWGFGKDLNKKIDWKRVKEQEGWKLVRYTLKEIAKLWKDSSFLKTAKNNKLDDVLWDKWQKSELCFKMYLDDKATKTELKRNLEDWYQICLKIFNLSKKDSKAEQIGELISGRVRTP